MGKKAKIQEGKSVDFVTVDEFISEQEYTVKAGDNLEKIAKKFDKEWKKIAEDNNINAPYELFINQKLVIK